MIRVAKQWGRDRIIRFFVDLINFLSGINYANDAMHLIKIGWCHSLFSVGKEQVTPEYPWVDAIKNIEIIIYK